MAWNTPVKYNKTLVIELADGTQRTLEGSAALAFQRILDDGVKDRIYWKLATAANKVEYINIAPSSSCGFCKVAEVTSGAAETTGIPCGEPMPDCDGDGELDNDQSEHYAYIVKAVESTDDPADLGLYEKNNYVYSLTEDTTPVEGKTYYEKKEV